MTNLEKFTAGEVAARHNGTLDQLREVIEHCFQRHKTIIYGTSKYYYLASWDKLNWDCNDTTDLPTIDITQLWEGLQALKKPEIWWIRVTPQNKQALEKWRGHGVFDTSIVGMVRDINGVRKGNATFGDNKADCWDFGNEIDFATFLKYTGVEPEKVEPIKGSTFEDTISELTQLINKRVDLRIKSDRLNDELTEINNQLSALLK